MVLQQFLLVKKWCIRIPFQSDVLFCCNQQQFKIKQQMSLPSLNSFPLLKPISIDILEEIEYSETILEVTVKLEQNGQNTYQIVLVDQLIIMYSGNKNGAEPLAFVRLDFSLKFQRIFFMKNLTQRVIKGFKLMNSYGQNISFFINFENLSLLWIHQLSKLINQSGFNNYFKPIRTLGKGNFATVYQIVRLDDGKRFAAKVFAKNQIKNSEAKMRNFMSQLQILRYIDHSNLLKLQGVFESEHSFYVIMETLGGGNLFQYLMKRKTVMTVDQIKIIMRNILKGLAQLEANGIVHRDIKLQNLMLKSKDCIEPVIVDFGLAVYQDEQDYIYYQCGTPGYLSPEVLSLKKGDKISSKSDIFSVAVVLHVLLTGKYLFQGKTSKQVFQNNRAMNFSLQRPQHSKIDPVFLQLLTKMLAKDPHERISASQCLEHPSLQMQQIRQQKFVTSPTSTNVEYKL